MKSCLRIGSCLGLLQLAELSFYFWLRRCGHMRGAARGCIASIFPRDLICWPVDKRNTWNRGKGELGQYVPKPWAPTILVSVNPLIMAFITSKNTRESVTRQEHAFWCLLSKRGAHAQEIQTFFTNVFTAAPPKKGSRKHLCLISIKRFYMYVYRIRGHGTRFFVSEVFWLLFVVQVVVLCR